MASGYLDELQRRFAHAFPDGNIARGLDRFRAIVGPTLIDGSMAAQAAAKLRDSLWPTAEELEALEKIIRMMRPVMLVQNGAAEGLHADVQPTFPQWDAFREQLKPFAYSIGAVIKTEYKRKVVYGTAFLVAPRLVMTNRHVVEMITHSSGVIDPKRVTIDFEQEYGVMPKKDAVAVERLVAYHPQHDLALLQLASAQTQPALPFASDAPAAGADIATVGYPVNDVARNPVFVNALFDGKFGVKRAAPGDVLSSSSEVVVHDCSTLGGNSGSPIFSVASGEVVAVHYGGIFVTRNEAVAGPIARDFAREHAAA
ncbi:MAG TPA: serine protease [Thermoanaerobaculia bacterium]|nr:serine protease [Thermoanaerobaculia bacterium]